MSENGDILICPNRPKGHRTDRGSVPLVSFRCLVITLSDRAAAGVYADRSGPGVRELLERFFAGRGREVIDRAIRLLPDDAQRFHDEIIRGIAGKASMHLYDRRHRVWGRGRPAGDGRALLRPVIPGIMEHIRAKFGGAAILVPVSRGDCRNCRKDADLHAARQRARGRGIHAGNPGHAGTYRGRGSRREDHC